MKVLVVDIPSNPSYPRRFIIKRTKDDGHTVSKQLGCPREAFFYRLFADNVRQAGTPIPDVLFAFGDMETGEKVLMIEDLSYYGVQSGYFFGPGTPLNWGHDLKAKTSKVPNFDSLNTVAIAKATLVEIAKLHRLFWKDQNLLQYPWLRGSEWIKGEGQATWEIAQTNGKNCWEKTKVKIEDGTSTVRWDENLLDCIDASFGKVNWEDFLAESKDRAWTLVHGDFHPANIMWVWHDNNHPHTKENGSGRATFFDWEMVGLGSGPQDVAQYFISHMDPELRRQEEKGLLEAYYHSLTEDNDGNGKFTKEDYSFEQCWSDYVTGGAGRWIWFVAYLSAMCPDKMTQYFHDQTATFLKDHGITPSNVGMPRV